MATEYDTSFWIFGVVLTKLWNIGWRVRLSTIIFGHDIDAPTLQVLWQPAVAGAADQLFR